MDNQPTTGQDPVSSEQSAEQNPNLNNQNDQAAGQPTGQGEPDPIDKAAQAAEAGGEQDPGASGEEGKPSRKDRRIDRLTRQLAQANEELGRRGPNYQPMKYEEGKYTAEDLERDRQMYGQTSREQGKAEATTEYQQNMWADRLEIDGERVANKYSQLDEESDQFDPDLTEQINEMYLATVGYDQRSGRVRNPHVRYKDYVEAFMGVVDRAASSRNAETATNIARQSSRTGVRPNGQRHSTIGAIKPGDISKMDSATYEKNKDAINAQINRELGIG